MPVLRLLLIGVLSLMMRIAWAEPIAISVRTVGKAAPDRVWVEQEGALNVVPLQFVPAVQAWEADIERPTTDELTALKSVMKPYVLVAEWGSNREQLYFGLTLESKAKIDFTVFHPPEDTHNNYAELDHIEALGPDLQSSLEKYFRARAFHRYWDTVDPRHSIAVRSARVWFDAVASLVLRAPDVFRRDAEVEKVLDDYNSLAATDPRLRERLRKYAPKGYIVGIVQQMVAAEYKFVGRIPDLIQDGSLEKARSLNDVASTSLSSEPAEIQKTVVLLQGVNTQLLRQNADYIATTQRESGATLPPG